ncbi:MAG: NADPH-dependent 7-cyano-7-deazaguanine reductase QueF [Desulfuromonadaceae bacterium]|nr:NADPH-dependent 7-cyano-7-deazaguanine reductase QueF [Desulfuromonadaceae bacterium]
MADLLLGKPTCYPERYDPSLLFPVSRQLKRDELGIGQPLPFQGEDLWNGYELSWLDRRGKPVIALAQFRIPCDSPCLIESKSFKLYLNSFNQTRFDEADDVRQRLQRDLSSAAGKPIRVTLFDIDDLPPWQIGQLPGTCLDDQEICIDHYQLNPLLLKHQPQAEAVRETLYSHLLKSNCLITSQPDWASIWIDYLGPAIDHEALLRYLISFRQHNEFHEQCVERIFTDLMRSCQPQQLSVYARYTRRGGLDINPWRSTEKAEAPNWRLVRQ